MQFDDEQLGLICLLPEGRRRVIHLESPPSVDADDRLRRRLYDMPFVPQSTKEPSSPGPHYKMWRLHSVIVRSACEAAGVEFLPAPGTSLADGMFVKPELYGRPCHADGGYGASVLRQLDMIA